MKTCDACKHYTPHVARFKNAIYETAHQYTGECALAIDSNDRAFDDLKVDIDRIASWDQEGFLSGVYVGPKFGCIHWEAAA
jgi:hypothetical protein